MKSVKKTYPHSLGLSCAFRQWRANSHCRFIHGYAMAFTIEFEADRLDENGWVIDFGSLKPIKAKLEKIFDHKLLVAQDDPYLKQLLALDSKVADLMILEAVGCEAFARMVLEIAVAHVQIIEQSHRVKVKSVEAREHEGNAAIFTNPT